MTGQQPTHKRTILRKNSKACFCTQSPCIVIFCIWLKLFFNIALWEKARDTVVPTVLQQNDTDCSFASSLPVAQCLEYGIVVRKVMGSIPTMDAM